MLCYIYREWRLPGHATRIATLLSWWRHEVLSIYLHLLWWCVSECLLPLIAHFSFFVLLLILCGGGWFYPSEEWITNFMSLFSDEIQLKFGLLVHPTSPLHSTPLHQDVMSIILPGESHSHRVYPKEWNSGGGELYDFFILFIYLFICIISC